MDDISPAMKMLRECWRRSCADPHLVAVLPNPELYQRQGHRALDMLGHLINPTATITEDQAWVVVNLIDEWAPRSSAPSIAERLPVATYINSCQA